MNFEYITQTATAPKTTWSGRELVRFHYFNPNGVMAAKLALDKEISKLVNDGKCNTGAIIAYGSLNYFYVDKLRDLLDMKRVNGMEAYLVIKCLEEGNKTAREFIANAA
jgi:hypothetical protein